MQELRTDRYKLKEIFPEKAKSYAQKLKIKAGELEYVRKGIPIEPKDIEIKEGERAAIRLVTTPHLDRDGEILIPSGAILDDFRQSPSVMWAHEYRSLPVGHDQWIKVVKEGILAKTFYANHQFAEDVYQCVKHGDLNCNSVGFIPVEAVEPGDKKQFEQTQAILEKDYGIANDESGKAKRIYTKWIMLEHSDVPIASNAQSLNLAVSKGELVIHSERLRKDLEIEVVKDEIKDQEIEVEVGPTMLEEVITKPETTDNYHRIPVEDADKHEGHRIRTITISAEQGIKAVYCGQCKKVLTYLFDVDKFSMEEARAWIEEHKDFKVDVPEEGENTESNSIVVTESDMTAWTTDTTAPVDNAALEAAIKGSINIDVPGIKELTAKVAELIVVITELKEIRAIEIPKEREIVIEKNGQQDNVDEKIAAVVEKLFEGDKLGKMINDAIKEALDITIKKKLGKVE
jgi:hypothetical protein